MAKKTLRKLPARSVSIFKIENRRGYAAVCRKNLTEGRSPLEAFRRMTKALKRSGYELKGQGVRS